MSNPSSETDDALTVVDALVEGLRPTHRKLNSQCARALRALGGRVLPILAAATRNPKIKLVHRRRIVEVCVLIDEDHSIDRSAGRLLIDALLGAFVIVDEELEARAVAALKCLPAPVIDELILAAHDADRRPKVRVRLLEAAGKLNMAPSVNRFLDLVMLTSARNVAIRDAASRLICRIKSEGNFAERIGD